MSRDIQMNHNGEYYSGNTYLGKMNHNGTLSDAKGNTVGSFNQGGHFSGSNFSGSVSRGGNISCTGSSGASISQSGSVRTNNGSFNVKGSGGYQDSAGAYFLMNQKK